MEKAILILDDDESIVTITQAILEDAGYYCVTALDGEEGLIEYAIAQPDLVIFDYLMPVMDGAAFVEQLREYERVRTRPRLPALVMFAASDKSKEAERLGAQFLAKPFELDALLAMVASLLGGAPSNTGEMVAVGG